MALVSRFSNTCTMRLPSMSTGAHSLLPVSSRMTPAPAARGRQNSMACAEDVEESFGDGGFVLAFARCWSFTFQPRRDCRQCGLGQHGS